MALLHTTPPTPPTGIPSATPRSYTGQTYLGDPAQTPLHLAGMQGDVVMAQFLVQYNANPQLNTQDGSSVMHIAALSGSVDVIANVRQKCRIKNKVTEIICAKNYELIFQRPEHRHCETMLLHSFALSSMQCQINITCERFLRQTNHSGTTVHFMSFSPYLLPITTNMCL